MLRHPTLLVPALVLLVACGGGGPNTSLLFPDTAATTDVVTEDAVGDGARHAEDQASDAPAPEDLSIPEDGATPEDTIGDDLVTPEDSVEPDDTIPPEDTLPPEDLLEPECVEDSDCAGLSDDPCTFWFCHPTDQACMPASFQDGTPCDDGDLCTTGEACLEGACAGGEVIAPLEVWDDPCNDLVCDPVAGWHPAPVDGPCDDGNPCTTEDHCEGGLCVGAPDPTCECDIDADCEDDGNLCNGGVHCVDNQCQPDGAAVVCPVSDMPCAFNLCDPDTGGCEKSPLGNGVGCNDGSACTTGDACHDGLCVGGPPPVCHDGNPCTADQCDPIQGCIFPFLNGVACDDGDGCTIHDKCSGGACAGSPKVCDDGNPCTDDACAAGACAFLPLSGAPCEDGDPCTAGDVCQVGVCGGGEDICPDCGDNSCDSEADEDCESCPQDCGWCPGPGSCCTPKEQAGCYDTQILFCVCPQQIDCCWSSWSAECVDIAIDDCGLECGPSCGDGDCNGSEDCGSCAQDCGDCDSSCCNAKYGPGCDDEICEDIVCYEDPFCCNGQWDGQCAVHAGQWCPVCGGGSVCGDGLCEYPENCQTCSEDCGGCNSNCCYPHDGPGCDDTNCQFATCQHDPYCCQVEWDEICTDWAQDHCSVCG